MPSDRKENGNTGIGEPIECFRCGICCIDYQPQVTIEEIELMAEQFAITAEAFIGSYVIITKVGYLLRQLENGCVFLALEEGAGKTYCTIYSFRPVICRDWQATLSRPQCRRGLIKLQGK